MSELGILDTFGVPEYFVTTIGRTEDAGGGCVRVFNCIQRGNELVTLFTVVIPATNLIIAARCIEEGALAVFNSTERVGEMAH